jgi:hypothetical protein
MKRDRQASIATMLPHEFLLAVARGRSIMGRKPTPAERRDAAKEAAPYYAPRLRAELMKIVSGKEKTRSNDG